MAITVDFTVSERVGDNYLSCWFTDTSSGTITSRKWILGDGRVVEGNETQVRHTYRTPGIYTVTLVASNASEQESEKKDEYIVVNLVPPDPQFIIAQSSDASTGNYWRLSIDPLMHLIWETNERRYRSTDPVVSVGQWSLVEFHMETLKMYVGSGPSFRKEITMYNEIVTTPIVFTETKLESVSESTLKIDELKVWGREEDLKDYYKETRAAAISLG